jgi:hypothetical protein
VWIKEEDLVFLDGLAEVYGVSRSEVIAKSVEIHRDVLGFYKYVGITPRNAMAVQGFMESVRSLLLCKESREEFIERAKMQGEEIV